MVIKKKHGAGDADQWASAKPWFGAYHYEKQTSLFKSSVPSGLQILLAYLTQKSISLKNAYLKMKDFMNLLF